MKHVNIRLHQYRFSEIHKLENAVRKKQDVEFSLCTDDTQIARGYQKSVEEIIDRLGAPQRLPRGLRYVLCTLDVTVEDEFVRAAAKRRNQDASYGDALNINTAILTDCCTFLRDRFGRQYVIDALEQCGGEGHEYPSLLFIFVPVYDGRLSATALFGHNRAFGQGVAFTEKMLGAAILSKYGAGDPEDCAEPETGEPSEAPAGTGSPQDVEAESGACRSHRIPIQTEPAALDETERPIEIPAPHPEEFADAEIDDGDESDWPEPDEGTDAEDRPPEKSGKNDNFWLELSRDVITQQIQRIAHRHVLTLCWHDQTALISLSQLLRLLSVLHTAVLEPENSRFIREPAGNILRLLYATLNLAEDKGRVLSRRELRTVNAISESIGLLSERYTE